MDPGTTESSGQTVSMAPVSLAPPSNPAPNPSYSAPSGNMAQRQETAGGEQGWCRWCMSTMANCAKEAAHPVTCLFHGLFKLVALLIYKIGAISSGYYVYTFILTTVLAALDFWTVKNVTGRILVGLRWWNNVKEDGSSEWVFESNPEESRVNSSDKAIFWCFLIVWPALWLLLLITNVFYFAPTWMLLDGLLSVFGIANLAGYWKCSQDAKQRARDMGSWAQGRAVRSLVSGMGF
mmetsp:Transcript_6792/g.11940  ORF Transcript_6792/g.11940 Transcript_6792/m.11940 type:complete len:236 (-) Transcript_6792:178-885(-)